MKYKVGDKVKVHTKEWFRTNCQENCIGAFMNKDNCYTFANGMAKFCEQEITINEEFLNHYTILEDNGFWCWEDWMFEDMNNNTNIIYNPNIVEDFAKLIGVELDEEFYDNESGWRYKFTSDRGLLVYDDKTEHWCVSLIHPSTFFKFVKEGKFIKKWMPKDGDRVYFPVVVSDTLYDSSIYYKDISYYRKMLERGLYFKTREEAIECAKKMIKQIKEG